MCHDDVLLLLISQKPILLPPENPYPQPRVRVFRGRGKDRRFLPAENPCHSLPTVREEREEVCVCEGAR